MAGEETLLPGDGVGRGGFADGTEGPGDTIGQFTLLRQLGKGSFGAVWLAERREPFRQEVALKIIRAGVDTEETIARFDQERQALALMNHPNVAKVFDGGRTPTGRPYFVMEYVKGVPISEYCDRERLPIPQRLRVFMQVCAAVQHAHAKGIIHRDLKPGNVLVALDGNGEPQVKVIDFGLAKAIDQRLTERAMFTEMGRMIGTPEYMSPEQAEPNAVDIDTRSDVYSLGVMLYELVAGILPFESSELRSRAYHEIQRIIREEDVPTPSTRLAAAGSDPERVRRIADARRIRLDALAASLRGELEWIPLKATRKERDARYGTAADLARDIENYLEGRPLMAGPISTAYKARKWLRRHRVAVAMVAVVAASLVFATVASTVFGIREARARALAEAREREVLGILDFQVRELSEIDADRAGLAMFGKVLDQDGRAMQEAGVPDERRAAERRQLAERLRAVNPADVAFDLVRDEVLRRAVVDSAAANAGEPLVHAGILMATGRTYQLLGDPAAARPLFEEALRTFGEFLGPDDRRTLRARESVLRAALATDEPDVTGRCSRLLEDRRRLLGPNDPDTVASLRLLADAHDRDDDPVAALAASEEVNRITSLVARNSVDAVADLSALGLRYADASRPLDAERAHAEALARVDRMPGAPKRLRAQVLTNLGLVRARMKEDPAKVQLGVAELEEALALDTAANGSDHTLTFDSRGNLAATLGELANAGGPDAERMARRSWELTEETLRTLADREVAPTSYYLAMNDRAVWVLQHPRSADPAERRRELESALALAAEAHRLLAKRFGPASGDTLAVQGSLASVHQALGDGAGAERQLRQVIAARAATWTPAYREMVNLRADLALALATQGRWKDAVDELAAAQETAAAKDGLPMESSARYLLAIRLLRFLEQWSAVEPQSPAAGRVGAQRGVVDALRAARLAAKPVPLWVDVEPARDAVPLPAARAAVGP